MITREELYHMVWTTPVQHVAAGLGISGTYLGRVCTALDVPRPPRGYWTMKLAGRSSPPPPLPVLRLGHPDRWSKNGLVTGPLRRFYRRQPADCAERSDLHPLAAQTFAALGTAKAKPGESVLRTRANYVVDLTTSAAALDRGIAVINTLLIAITKKGHPVTVRPQPIFIRPPIDFYDPSPAIETPRQASAPLWPTIATVEDTPIGMAVLEIHEAREMQYAGNGLYRPAAITARKNAARTWGLTWKEHRWAPTGRFKIVAYSPLHTVKWRCEWGLDSSKDLAAEIDVIVVELESAARRLADAYRRSAPGRPPPLGDDAQQVEQRINSSTPEP